ncbi:MAG TPA: hemerythrin domain-containing protein [Pyrinomonadaceae bacterium]|nr:hemerythrin domain-containing protein [Pyrinomonadaceae bacterium]
MNVFELLKQDHQKVSGLFQRIEAASATGERQQLFVQLKQELDLHAQVEETILYPALKQAEATRNITLEAYEEHQEVKDLLAEIQQTPPDDEEWTTLVMELRESVEHHVEEEEGEMFAQARDVLTEQQIDEISQRIEAAKRQAQAAGAS